MRNVLVSVIIPAFNASEHIIETLHSIRNQTYTNWEIIVVNDCSTDETVNLVNQFPNEDRSVIKVISNKTNLGVCASRNIAVAHSAGTWLALLDSDDVWLPNHLETLMHEVSINSELDVVFSGFDAFLGDVNNIIFKQKISKEMWDNFNLSLFTHNLGITSSTAVIKKKSWSNIGGMIQGLDYCEEMELFIRLAKAGAKFKFSSLHTTLYRKHSNAGSASYNNAKMALGTIYIYEKHFDWEEMPLEIRINLLANSHVTYARLTWRDDITSAAVHCLKALKLNPSLLRNISWNGYSIRPS
jgi:glycosyltransferase involved in cell wall biosynthesis